MKAHLMFRDHDFDVTRPLPPRTEALVQDLELTTLFTVMARNDKHLTEVLDKAVLSSCTDPDTILYRQDVLRDCLWHESAVRDMYAIAGEAMEARRKSYLGSMIRYPGSVLNWSIQLLEAFVELLKRLRGIADDNIMTCGSEGMTTFFRMLQRELDDAYFAQVKRHLRELKFPRGVWLSARLGQGNRGSGYVLRTVKPPMGSWIERLFAPPVPAHTFRLHPRDEAGARSLSELRDRGINLVADALAQSVDHILSFFQMMWTELAFYVGCLNLHRQLAAQGERVCFPKPSPSQERSHAATGLYDICLALTMQRQVIGNDLRADGRKLVVITGANQGGKSTFLRAVGLAQVMMQCGMFVAAERFSANISSRIFTHYRREEDAEMKSGKFDEELGRMSDIVDHILPGSLMLFNESFASTNEREGSEIGRQVVGALIDRCVKVFFVTHQYDLAHGFQVEGSRCVLFLRAERQVDGSRTFKLNEGDPERTSHGEDLYRQIFLGKKEPAPSAPELSGGPG